MNSKKNKKVHPCPAFIAVQIKFWRKEKLLTQKKLSELSGIKFRHIQKIESGKVDLKIRTLGSISIALGITPHMLLTPVEENRSFMCETCKNLK